MHLKRVPNIVQNMYMAQKWLSIVSNLIIAEADGSRMISTVLNQFSILDFQYRLDSNDEQFGGHRILDKETSSANCFSN